MGFSEELLSKEEWLRSLTIKRLERLLLIYNNSDDGIQLQNVIEIIFSKDMKKEIVRRRFNNKLKKALK